MPCASSAGSIFLVDAQALVQLAVYFLGDGLECGFLLAGVFFHGASAGDMAAQVGHADLIEFFEVGRENGNELDALVEGQRVVVCFEQYAVVERQPADVAVEVFISAFHVYAVLGRLGGRVDLVRASSAGIVGKITFFAAYGKRKGRE